MALNASFNIGIDSRTTVVRDLSTSVDPIIRAIAASFTSGTGDGQADGHWSDTRSAAASADALDLSGVLTGVITAATVSAVEVVGILIINHGTAAAHVLSVGGGSNPAFSGLFGATGDIIKVPAGGTGDQGIFFWKAHYDGGGLAVTNSTADILTIDPGANTISYDIFIWYRTA